MDEKKLSATEKEDQERGIYSNENSTVNWICVMR